MDRLEMNDFKSTRISIIGVGVLGGAVTTGLAKAGCGVLASDTHIERLGHLKREGVDLVSDNMRAVTEGEVVMFALKPHILLRVVKEYAHLLKGKLCVSLAAAVTLDMLEKAAPEVRWMRAMSNLCAALNCAFTGITKSRTTTDADLARIKGIFALLGELEEVDEKNLDALTALTASAPAFFMPMVEAAAMGGVQVGLPIELSYRGAMSAMLGAARLCMEAGKHPATLRDEVCTPGGMTIDGIYEIERAGTRATMMKAVVVTAEKCKELAEKAALTL